MTKKDMKLVNEWKDGEFEQIVLEQAEIEFDAIGGLDDIPRVVVLRALGYKIDTFEAYAWAEINEMKKAA